MGRFSNDETIVRKIDGGIVILRDRNRIYLVQGDAQWHTVFHRYGAPLGSYSGWRLFRQELRQYKNLTPSRVHELAIRYGVVQFVSYSKIELGKNVVYK